MVGCSQANTSSNSFNDDGSESSGTYKAAHALHFFFICLKVRIYLVKYFCIWS